MNIYPSFTSLRSFISYKFSIVRMSALRDSFWAKLTGLDSKLEVFPGKAQRISPSRKLIGMKEIRVDQIVGTFNRGHDFDHQFRPLKKHMSNRWVNAFITLERDGWAPILVHKVGEQYFVEDGHHRVSVARSIGMVFIEAKVWEYTAQSKHTETCQSANCPERSSSKTYATG